MHREKVPVSKRTRYQDFPTKTAPTLVEDYLRRLRDGPARSEQDVLGNQIAVLYEGACACRLP
jgi:hypothetical protein